MLKCLYFAWSCDAIFPRLPPYTVCPTIRVDQYYNGRKMIFTQRKTLPHQTTCLCSNKPIPVKLANSFNVLTLVAATLLVNIVENKKIAHTHNQDQYEDA